MRVNCLKGGSHPLTAGEFTYMQLSNTDNITSITKTQLLNYQQQDTSIKPVYQFVQLAIKPSKKEWNSLSYYRRLFMKQLGKRKIHNIILVLETKEYSHIVLPASLRNIVLNKLHSKMAHF